MTHFTKPFWTLPALWLLLMVLLVAGCSEPPSSPAPRAAGPDASLIQQEPTLRVRVAEAVGRAVLGGDGLRIGGADGSSGRTFPAPVTVQRDGGRFLVKDGRGRTVASPAEVMQVRSPRGTVQLDGRAYPQSLSLVASDAQRFDVINHVGLETYLPGVLSKELYGSWDEQAYAAQAIAARSYALFQRARQQGRHYDVAGTVADQVYGGSASSQKARDAVQRTRGQVLTDHGRVIPAFFSSACGGRAQDAGAIFAHYGESVQADPLNSGRTGNWCQISPHAQWGPVLRDTDALTKRLARWGRINEHDVARLRELRAVKVAGRSRSGRPTRFVLTGVSGQRCAMGAEDFRFACNQPHPELPELTKGRQLKSSQVNVRVMGNLTRFTGGRGFGHGVGLCQWGAQGMALRGHDAMTILGTFYPGAGVRRLY